MAIVYGLKVNLSVAMVAMLNHTALKAASADLWTPKSFELPTVNFTSTTELPTLAADDDCSSSSVSSATVEVFIMAIFHYF